jgi:homocysteine S-methyltransferase
MSTPYASLKARLDAGDAVILDGATGTELQRRGAPMDPSAWCGPATLGNDALLTAIHADYIRAGAEIVTANTFAASRIMLKGAGLADRSDEIVARAVDAALKARQATGGGAGVVVAGSLSHMVPVSSGTDTVDLSSVPSDSEVSEAFHALATALRSAGCELILLEMMYHPGRARLAVEAALSTGLPVWYGMSARRGPAGEVLAFHHADDLPLSAITSLVPPAGVDTVGIMHTGSELVSDAVAEIRKGWGGPIAAYPDSGYFEMPDWKFVDVIPAERLEGYFRRWLREGVQIIGGCCGLGVPHIEAAARARDAVRAERRP